MKADIIIKNGMVLTMDRDLHLYDRADVAISGSKIVDISTSCRYEARKNVDAGGKLVMPGLINTHTHAAMTLLRGTADDLPLDIWLKKYIFPIEKKYVTPEFIRIGVSLAAIEMIKSGTTSFADMYYFEDEAAEVCKKIGIRAFLGEGLLDFPTPSCANPAEGISYMEDLHKKWKGAPTIHLMVTPHTTYTCSPEIFVKARELAERLDIPLQTHVSETAGENAEVFSRYGKTPVQHLEQIGCISDRLIAVHCVHLNNEDMRILKNNDVKISHCQESNMKLASGNAPVVELQSKGITVGLGTDGAASNNNLDLFDEMDAVAKVHKLMRSDPTVMDAKTVLRMATTDGAKVLQKPDIGSLEVGKTADIIILDLDRPHLTPLYNIYSHLVYSAGGSEVNTAIINGRIVMEDRKMLSIDEEEVMAQANQIAKKIKSEIAI